MNRGPKGWHMSTTSTASFLEDQGYSAVSLVHTTVGQLQVDAIINDRPALLIVDTGASETVIDQASAERLGVSFTGDAHQAVGCGIAGPADRATINSLNMGPIELSDVNVYVFDLSQVNDALEAKTGTRVDGVIGADLLKRGEAIIEYAQGTLHLKF